MIDGTCQKCSAVTIIGNPIPATQIASIKCRCHRCGSPKLKYEALVQYLDDGSLGREVVE